MFSGVMQEIYYHDLHVSDIATLTVRHDSLRDSRQKQGLLLIGSGSGRRHACVSCADVARASSCYAASTTVLPRLPSLLKKRGRLLAVHLCLTRLPSAVCLCVCLCVCVSALWTAKVFAGPQGLVGLGE